MAGDTRGNHREALPFSNKKIKPLKETVFGIPPSSCLEAVLQTGSSKLHAKNDGTERYKDPDSLPEQLRQAWGTHLQTSCYVREIWPSSVV